MQEISLALTGILAMCAGASYRRLGRIRSVRAGVGFFAASYYIDGIFWIIMENGAGDSWRPLLHGVGILVSKSIMLVLLLALNALRPSGEDSGELWESAKVKSGSRSRPFGESGNWHGAAREGSWDQSRLAGKKPPAAQGLARENASQGGEAARGWEYMDVLTIGIGFMFVILAWWVQGIGRRTGDFGTALFLAFLLAVLAGYYVSCWLYGRGLRRKKLQLAMDAQKAQTDLYLESVEDHYQRTRELWHDLKNHVNLLNLLLQEEKYEQMADYLRILGEDVDSLTLPAKSGNLVADAVLADKAARAKREGIRVEAALCDLTGLELRADEICGLLGNLLDNALEANAQVKEGRFLRVIWANKTSCYYLKIENACSGRPGGPGAVLESGKSDRRNRVGHGLGLRSAERIVHGCGGELAIESGEGCFAVVVRLPKERGGK